MKRKILILTNYPSDLSSFSGGVETATASLLEGLKQYFTEFEFSIAAIDLKAEEDRRIVKDGYTFYFFAPFGRHFRPHSLWSGLKIFKIVKTLNPDIIHVNGNVILGFWTSFCKQRKIYTIHGIPKKERKVWSGIGYWGILLESLLQNYVFLRFKHIITLTKENAIHFTKHQIIYNVPNSVRSKFLLDTNNKERNRILFVGGLTRMKGVDMLLEAYNDLDDKEEVKLTLVGEMKEINLKNKIDEYKFKYGNKIEVIENAGIEKLTELFYSSKLFILLSRQENMPIVLLEAMACGVPVIASDVGAIPEMIEDGVDGYIFKNGDVASLKNILKNILYNQNKLENIGEAARRKVLKYYTPDVISAKTVGVYKTLLNEKN